MGPITRTYDDAVEASESTLLDAEDFGPLDVRCIERDRKRMIWGRNRVTRLYLVVNHETDEVLHEGRPVYRGGTGASPMEASAKAHGIAAGWLLGHPDHEWL
jgi:hypothetical protein